MIHVNIVTLWRWAAFSNKRRRLKKKKKTLSNYFLPHRPNWPQSIHINLVKKATILAPLEVVWHSVCWLTVISSKVTLPMYHGPLQHVNDFCSKMNLINKNQKNKHLSVQVVVWLFWSVILLLVMLYCFFLHNKLAQPQEKKTACHTQHSIWLWK